MTFTFTISGNATDPNGNPVPKAKLTRGQQWTPKAQAYAAWKAHVNRSFVNAWAHIQTPEALRGRRIALSPKQHARMQLKIYWANEKHGDAENVFGSIADAIFESDKHLDGQFVATHTEGKGRVDVKISI